MLIGRNTEKAAPKLSANGSYRKPEQISIDKANWLGCLQSNRIAT